MYKLTALIDSSLERTDVVRSRLCVERKCSKNWATQSADAARGNTFSTESNHGQE